MISTPNRTIDVQIVSAEGKKEDISLIIERLVKGDKGDTGPRGPMGFRGSLDNFVVMSEYLYERLDEKDPNIFYFTYEDDTPGPGPGPGPEPTGDEYIQVETNTLYISTISGNSIIVNGVITNNVLNI